MRALLRFLEFVRRELSADDARAEIGGREPGPEAVWASMPGGLRVVAIFPSPPEDPAALRARLEALVESFAGVGSLEELPTGSLRPAPANDLEGALEVLALRARAVAALVIDDRSPVVWGSSLKPGPGDVDDACWLARVARDARACGAELGALVAAPAGWEASIAAGADGVDGAVLVRDVTRVREHGARAGDRLHVAAAEAIAAARADEAAVASREGTSVLGAPLGAVLVRPFATIYRVLLVFDGPVSELHAEGALIHGLPVIERLVTALPPREPEGGGAKVAVLRRLRRV